MKIVHRMQCRTSQICTCVASSSVIATITLIELFTCQHIQIHANTYRYMPTHTDTCQHVQIHANTCRYMPTRADTCQHVQIHANICTFLQEHLSHMRAYRIRKYVQRYRNAKKIKTMQRKIS